MTKTSWVGALAGLAALAFATPSWASGDPATAGALQFGLGFRYGADQNDGDFNPWGTGLGLEGGYTLPVLDLYLGANAEYFFGIEEKGPGVAIDGHLWQFSGEAGYDIGLGRNFVIRPKLGLGIASSSTKICLAGIDCATDSSNNFLVAPGARFMLFTKSISLAFDIRYAVVMADPDASKAIIFSAGIGF